MFPMFPHESTFFLAGGPALHGVQPAISSRGFHTLMSNWSATLSSDVYIKYKIPATTLHQRFYLPDPNERLVEFRINALNVIYRQLLIQHLFIEWHRKSTVYEFTVI